MATAWARMRTRLTGLLTVTAVQMSLLIVAVPQQPAFAAAGGSTLGPNQILTGGQYLISPNSEYLLYMNTVGNLILFFWNTTPSVLWQTGTSGHSGGYLYEQGWDGNLVLYDSGGHAYWATNQYSANSTLSLQNDANLIVYTSGGSPIWATNTVNSYLTGGQTLYPGQYLQDANRLYQLIMQSDGNLVLYYTWSGRSGPLWASGTNGYNGAHAVMQTDGNLVVYDTANIARWATGTNGYSGVYLGLQTDGNVVLYGTPGPWNTENQVYNRQGAANYADSWVSNATTLRHPNYPSFSNDCTNFISQAMSAGGHYPQQGGSSSTDDTQWWLHYNSFWNNFTWSNSWSVSLDNLVFLQNQDPGGSMGSLLGSQYTSGYAPSGMMNGDTLYYDWGTGEGISHATIQVSVGTDPVSQYFGTLVDQHTNDRYHAIYTLQPYNANWMTTTIYLEHIY